jgi:hypothetical protein
LTGCLNELLSVIETWFPSYLGMDKRVPLPGLSAVRRQLSGRVGRLRKKFDQQGDPQTIVFSFLDEFTARLKSPSPATLREIHYYMELVSKLEMLSGAQNGREALRSALIEANFNSPAFVMYLKRQVLEGVQQRAGITTQLEELLFIRKEFDQVYRRPGVALQPQDKDLREVMSEWCSHEIVFLERKIKLTTLPVPGVSMPGESTPGMSMPGTAKQASAPPEGQESVLCDLSGDQIGLILRAANDVQILLSPSVNKLFKTIVPYLSTSRRKTIHPDSTRSSSYNPEERDKEIVIGKLQQMISRIREF